MVDMVAPHHNNKMILIPEIIDQGTIHHLLLHLAQFPFHLPAFD
jgi:hypothetical protein